METYAATVDKSTQYIGAIPLPDELLAGWQGRVRALENLRRSRDVEELLKIRAKLRAGSIRKQSDIVDVAAVVLGCSATDLWRAHTLMPYFSALVPNKRSFAPRWVHNSLQFRRQSYFRIGSEYPMLCPGCIQKDFESMPYSYWRRSHHLPGVLWCTEHQIPLIRISDNGAYKQCPHLYLNSSMPIFTGVDSLAKNPVLSRYVAIATKILLSAPVVDSAIATAAFNRRALAAKLSVKKRRLEMTVSQFARQSVPERWLSIAFSYVIGSKRRYIYGIDQACSGNRPRYTTTTFCLLAALLYDDPEEAVHELCGGQVKPTSGLGVNHG